jgi:hypothetical protein
MYASRAVDSTQAFVATPVTMRLWMPRLRSTRSRFVLWKLP